MIFVNYNNIICHVHVIKNAIKIILPASFRKFWNLKNFKTPEMRLAKIILRISNWKRRIAG